jgi:hypothetical protein
MYFQLPTAHKVREKKSEMSPDMDQGPSHGDKRCLLSSPRTMNRSTPLLPRDAVDIEDVASSRS